VGTGGAGVAGRLRADGHRRGLRRDRPAGLFAIAAPGPAGSILSASVLVAGAATAVGALLGFLFGIPRTTQDQGQRTGGPAELPYSSNTNLEQISDWLTKILVGVGLIELGRMPGPAARFITDLADDLGAGRLGRTVLGAAVVFFGIIGFLVAYVETRTDLGGAFTRADRAAMREVAEEVAQQHARDQQRKDAAALSLVARQLDPPPGATMHVSQEQFNAVLSAATPAIRSLVFSLARGHRADAAARTPRDRVRIDRTIPVFRALVAADPHAHRHHGQLGYALKERTEPDLDEAERALTQAADLRDRHGESGWLYYELNRAAVRITRVARGQPGTADCADILSDLRKAATNARMLELIRGDREIQEWLRSFAADEVDLQQHPGQPTRR
jgi:hypothetical protein